jgi:acid phosphatase family membrane protein YuiD
MQVLEDLFGNYILVSAAIAWALAQITKVFTNLFSSKKFQIKMMFSNGGMPSSHSSTVVALCTACAIRDGFASTGFAVSLILAMIVMNDAFGVRYEAGKHAKIINRIAEELFSGDPTLVNSSLKELVGHTPFQVFIGALLGVAVAIVYALILGEIPV